jgi:hypothetical protein
MKNEDKDLRKEIEDLEKLIDQVRKQNEEEKKKLRTSIRDQRQKRVIRINLAMEYSDDFWINASVGFLVNFILIFAIVNILNLAEVANNFIYLIVAFAFTIYESLVKLYLFRYQQKIIFYSRGVIFFLMNLIFFYAMDLFLLPTTFNFANNLFPVAFVFTFMAIRIIIKNIYGLILRGINQRVSKKVK